MPRSTLPSQFFLPQSAIRLGRFLTSLEEPSLDYHDPTRIGGPETVEKIQIQYESRHRSTSDQETQSQLTSFISSSFSKRLETSVQLTAERARSYQVDNAAQWFRKAVQSQETREWIERVLDEGKDIYLVFGYQTLQDARITASAGSQKSIHGKATVPISEALTASGVVVPLGDLVDPGLEAFRDQLADDQKRFVAPGEQIFAVQYVKVRCKWFVSDRLDKLSLEKETRWVKYDGLRDFQGEAEDVIEVELGGEVAFDDNEGNTYEWMVELGEPPIQFQLAHGEDSVIS